MFSYSNGVMLFSANRKKVLSRRLTFNKFGPITILSVKNGENNGLHARVSFLSPSRAKIPPSPSLFTPATQASYAGYKLVRMLVRGRRVISSENSVMSIECKYHQTGLIQKLFQLCDQQGAVLCVPLEQHL